MLMITKQVENNYQISSDQDHVRLEMFLFNNITDNQSLINVTI